MQYVGQQLQSAAYMLVSIALYHCLTLYKGDKKMADVKAKVDCFAYCHSAQGKAECRILTDLYCAKKGKCSFYKTVEQVDEETNRADERLISLGIKVKKVRRERCTRT